MATVQRLNPITVEAGTAVTIYRFLALAADGQYDHVAAAQARADGVSLETQATVGGTVPMQPMDGSIVKVEAGAAVTAGGLIASDTVGRVIDHVAAADNHALGKALDAAAAAGEIIRVQNGPVVTDSGA